jgi:hypothetical protein
MMGKGAAAIRVALESRAEMRVDHGGGHER